MKKNTAPEPKKETLLPPAYQASVYEADIYGAWEKGGYFKPLSKPDDGVKPFCVVMPPPNTTGQLHLGHASALAYEDLMVRYKRMSGFDALFIPGTDHAAIATQNKVERILETEGKTRQSLGREAFLDCVRSFVGESQGVIKSQIRAMGASCDWSREAYTFDAVSSRIVAEVFVRMYNDGLIYRGDRIVNWCTRCQSVLADDEVEYREKKTPFYYLKYGPVVIGTARPETKFRDKTIIVHPDDTRYQGFIGKEFDVPWIEGTVRARVIADVVANPELGSGAMTITPAHSFEDFELAKKYNLPVEQIITTDGTLTPAAGAMAGMDAFEARLAVVEALRKKGLVERIDEEYVHNLSVCYRCGTPVQPLISKQWFVDVQKKVPGRDKSLKELAIDMVDSGATAIIPERFKKVYMHWMENLHDWCISRQIWWGHQIPVWYGVDGRAVASAASPGAGYTQDPDTLDTWFSSATWTFSTLLNRDHAAYATFDEWLKASPDLARFHPTSVLETGYDIIFFWVARMMLITGYVLGEKPFDTVYLHGLVRDKEGRKMSKSLGNGIDPIEMIEKYGADALRLALIIGSAPGTDVRLYDEKIAGYRNFVNKLWNISRYVLMTVADPAMDCAFAKLAPQDFCDRAILEKLRVLIEEVTGHFEKFNFSAAGEKIYQFTWSEFADWYIEVVKVRPGSTVERDRILLYVLRNLVVLWHPFAPFVTEVIGKHSGIEGGLIRHAWPRAQRAAGDADEAMRYWDGMQEVIQRLRLHKKLAGDFSGEMKFWVSLKQTSLIQDTDPIVDIIGSLARVQRDESIGDVSADIGPFTLYIDKHTQERVRAHKEKERSELEQYRSRIEQKLSDEHFIKNAPPAVVAQERAKLDEVKRRLGV